MLLGKYFSRHGTTWMYIRNKCTMYIKMNMRISDISSESFILCFCFTMNDEVKSRFLFATLIHHLHQEPGRKLISALFKAGFTQLFIHSSISSRVEVWGRIVISLHTVVGCLWHIKKFPKFIKCQFETQLLLRLKRMFGYGGWSSKKPQNIFWVGGTGANQS